MNLTNKRLERYKYLICIIGLPHLLNIYNLYKITYLLYFVLQHLELEPCERAKNSFYFIVYILEIENLEKEKSYK